MLCGNYILSNRSEWTFYFLSSVQFNFTIGVKNVLKKYKNLDYISCWFFLGKYYIRNTKAKFAFVSTNSIFQGEQVGLLWPSILSEVYINFAYHSFKWSNSAKNNAGVTVVIVGFTNNSTENKYIYSGTRRVNVRNINAYLIDGPNVIIPRTSHVLNYLPKMIKGSQPSDGGGLILSKVEGENIKDKVSSQILRKYIGAKDYLNGDFRYCLWMNKKSFQDNQDNPIIKSHIEKVKKFREHAKSQAARDGSKKSWEFLQRGEYVKAYGENLDKSKMTIIVPRVTSGSRQYVPFGLVDSSVIIADSAMAIYNAQLWILGLLESKIHMVWLQNVGGRLKQDYRYSAGLVYNTFPIPKLSTRRKNEIEQLVLNILDIREEEGGTLAELYGSPLAEKNPKPMNPRLLKAHQELDQVVDRAYKPNGFRDDNERLALLLDMYSKKVNENESTN